MPKTQGEPTNPANEELDIQKELETLFVTNLPRETVSYTIPVVEPKQAKAWKKRINGWNYGIKKRKGDLVLNYEWAANFPVCIYCTLELCAMNAGLDHKTPISIGGEDVIANLQVICQKCNRAKGPLTAEQFMALIILLESPPFDDRSKKVVINRMKAAWRVV